MCDWNSTKEVVNCDELEYIKKCMQVQEDQEEDYLKHQTSFSQIQLPNTECTPLSTIKLPNVELKPLPQHLRYTFLREY